MKTITTSISGVEVLIQVADDNGTNDDGGKKDCSMADLADMANTLPLADELSVGHTGVTVKHPIAAAPDALLFPDVSGRASKGAVKQKTKEPVVKDALERSFKPFFAFADSIKKQSEMCNNVPDEMEIEYSLTLDAETKLWVITIGTESNIKVRMKWNKENNE